MRTPETAKVFGQIFQGCNLTRGKLLSISPTGKKESTHEKLSIDFLSHLNDHKFIQGLSPVGCT